MKPGIEQRIQDQLGEIGLYGRIKPPQAFTRDRTTDRNFDDSGRMRDDARQAIIPPFSKDFTVAGALSTGQKVLPLPANIAGRVIGIRARVGTAPSGAQLQIQVTKEGRLLGVTELGTVQIDAGARYGESPIYDETSTVNPVDYIGFEILSAAGATNLTLSVLIKGD